MTIEYPPGRPHWMPIKGRPLKKYMTQSRAFSKYLHDRCTKHGYSTKALAKLHEMTQPGVWRRVQNVREKERGNGMNEYEKRVTLAVRQILRWGMFEGEHHKQWTLDSALRLLLGNGYDDAIRDFNSYTDDDGEKYPPWDEGIAP